MAMNTLCYSMLDLSIRKTKQICRGSPGKTKFIGGPKGQGSNGGGGGLRMIHEKIDRVLLQGPGHLIQSCLLMYISVYY